MRELRLAAAAIGVVWALCAAPPAGAATPRPTSTNGRPVQLVASGLGTPTSFAFGGATFEGDSGAAASATTPAVRGGVYVLRHGAATRLAGSPTRVLGLAFWRGTLYVSAVNQLLAWSTWNGTTFVRQKVVWTGPTGFTGLGGLGFGANGQLYAGVWLGWDNDHGPATTPYEYDLLRFDLPSTTPHVVATGIRQPWQLAFAPGTSAPFVSDLGQDEGATDPPDFVLHVGAGDNYGFPTCNWTAATACAGFTKPFRAFPAHTDVMGLGIDGSTLYMSEFSAAADGTGLVQALPITGVGQPTTLLQNFSAPVVGLTVHDDWVYVGSLSGQVFRVSVG